MTGAKSSGSSSKVSPQIESEEKLGKTKFVVLQKNMRSMNSSESIEELFIELHQVTWDAILISETWRQGKEIWETQQGHIMVESGKFINKHGVAILLNRRWKNKINWVQCVCERVVALSISVNKQPITLMSVYMPHSGYPDHHVEKTYKTILTTIGKEKNMKIIGGDFNAELGPGEGIELSSVGHYTLNKASCRGEWMTQWLLDNSFVALNTMYKKVPQKQLTYHTPKKIEKQLDYILIDKKHYSWSRDAEANDTIHMGSDHRCVMAKFEILTDKSKSRHTKAPRSERECEKCENGNEQKYRDLEQEVKEVEPGTSKESTTKEATNTKAKAKEQKPKAGEDEAHAAPAATAAADGQTITKTHAEAAEGAVTSEAPEMNEKDERIRALIQERKTTTKDKKDRIREISKEIKIYQGKQKDEKTGKNSEDLGKSQRNKKHTHYQISEETNPYPKGQRQRRRNHQDETRNCQRFCKFFMKTYMKAKEITLEET